MNEAHWTGETGVSYTFEVYEIDWSGVANANTTVSSKDGNYIFAKISNGRWQPVYIGQGNLHDRYYAAIREGCISRKGATHYHAHHNPSTFVRVAEETDLIRGNTECLIPTGCNERVP